MAKFNKNNNKTKRGWKLFGSILSIILVVAFLGGAATLAISSLRERNPDNLIKVDENYAISRKTGYGLEVVVDDDGTIRLKGQTSKNEQIIVQTVTLPAGEYTISGIEDPNLAKIVLKATWGTGNVAYAGLEDKIVLEEETAVEVSIDIQGCEDGENTISWKNATIRPVIVAGDEPGDFYK